MAIDPYLILGVAQDASINDIKAAYRRIAVRLHPDKNKHLGAALQFQDVNEAHAVLLDPSRRADVDRSARERANQKRVEFALRVTPSKRRVQNIAEPQILYLLAEIYAEQSTLAQAEQRSKDARLNLTIAIDRSNSMSGARLDRVKSATNKIVETLTAKDIFSLVTFNDFADVVIDPAPVENTAVIKGRVNMLTASGGTEILRGLRLAVEQNRARFNPEFVNHILLLTDGHTYGDHDGAVTLAAQLAKEGIGVSAIGIGQDWNDEFLDKLTSTTGGSVEYVMNINSIQRYFDDHVRALANTFAERLSICVAPDPDVAIEAVVKLSPRLQPLDAEAAPILLGNLQFHRLTSVLFQLELPGGLPVGYRSLARIAVKGDILVNGMTPFNTVSDFSLGVEADAETDETPVNILDALNKLTLYRMQERAQESLARGDVKEATRRLNNLATRYLEYGEEELAKQALAEARQVEFTKTLSEQGRKALKYHTRSLLLGPGKQQP